METVERFLAYVASIKTSPYMIKAYGVHWRTARLEDLAGFVA